MDKFPLLHRSVPIGELTCCRDADGTLFALHCRLPEEGLWCAWAVGDRGELRLGVVESTGRQASLRRRFSDRMTASLGQLCRGELRPADGGKRPEVWEETSSPESLFRTAWLRQRLRGIGGARFRKTGTRLFLALPWDCKKPFPLTTLFCFARIREMEGGRWAVFAFDQEEKPVF